MPMPPLETERLIVRPYVMGDLEAISQDSDAGLTESPTSSAHAARLEERREWLLRQIAFYETLEERGDPPFGDRAVVLKATGALIGATGYALYLGNFGRLPSFSTGQPADHLNRVEPGLYWAIDPAHRRQGYASEAARALIRRLRSQHAARPMEGPGKASPVPGAGTGAGAGGRATRRAGAAVQAGGAGGGGSNAHPAAIGRRLWSLLCCRGILSSVRVPWHLRRS